MSDQYSYLTHYDQMPLPIDFAATEVFDAGDLSVGVQVRILTDDIVEAQELAAASGSERGKVTGLDDHGIAMHVFDNRGEHPVECIRFDCFEDTPHYHYVSWQEKRNEMAYIDPVALGDPVAWSLNTLRTNLPRMIAFAIGADAARTINYQPMESVFPLVSEAVYRAIANSKKFKKINPKNDKSEINNDR